MSTVGERKCAMLLVSLRQRDRRRLLARLPAANARSIRALLRELERSRLPVVDAAKLLLADELRGLTEQTSPGVEQLVGLSAQLPPAWFARVLSAWTGIDRGFCIELLDPAVADEVRRHMDGMAPLPPKLVDALKAEALDRLAARPEAA